MIPTPDLSHLTKEDYARVYEPAEDTFLLLDALEEDAIALREARFPICLEIGPGSGCVTAFLGSIIGPTNALYLTSDINPHAALCTHQTGLQNQIPVHSVMGSLALPLVPRLRQNIDILLFNPPYVPTSNEEAALAQTDRGIAGAWAGGADGMEVTNQLLASLDSLLSPTGRFYLVALTQNDIPGITRRTFEQGFACQVVLKRRAGGEHLHVLRFTRVAAF
ncbi:S-adenosyl-L-methionine-dependent methyltransferase [Auriculariales sp. MPI-PUGE-AT-0066]|nr:S-adenosyl-L-methionine-dependent methyltransferase [Auriculariales sp. MPI-PUGE-AT-0066]